MKKLFFLFSLMSIFSLAACGGSDLDADDPTVKALTENESLEVSEGDLLALSSCSSGSTTPVSLASDTFETSETVAGDSAGSAGGGSVIALAIKKQTISPSDPTMESTSTGTSGSSLSMSFDLDGNFDILIGDLVIASGQWGTEGDAIWIQVDGQEQVVIGVDVLQNILDMDFYECADGSDVELSAPSQPALIGGTQTTDPVTVN